MGERKYFEIFKYDMYRIWNYSGCVVKYGIFVFVKWRNNVFYEYLLGCICWLNVFNVWGYDEVWNDICIIVKINFILVGVVVGYDFCCGYCFGWDYYLGGFMGDGILGIFYSLVKGWSYWFLWSIFFGCFWVIVGGKFVYKYILFC